MNKRPNDTAPARAGSLYTLLVFATFLLVLIAVVFSAYLRLVGSGLGCAEWPACYALIKSEGGSRSLAAAHLVPAWATAVHRLVAATLGVLVIGVVVNARRRAQPGQGLAIPFVALGLTVFLAVLGYQTPSPLRPAVALGNLLGGMALAATLWWLGKRLVSATRHDPAAARPRPWALAGLFVIAVQIALGGWVSANFAALACTGLPGCGGYPWLGGPWQEGFDLARTLAATPAGAVIAGDDAKVIHMMHRAGAVIASLYIGWLAWRAIVLGGNYRATGIVILVLLVLQMLLGISAVAFSLPLGVVTAHNAVAALLLLSIINLIHHLTPRARS